MGSLVAALINVTKFSVRLQSVMLYSGFSPLHGWSSPVDITFVPCDDIIYSVLYGLACNRYLSEVEK